MSKVTTINVNPKINISPRFRIVNGALQMPAEPSGPVEVPAPPVLTEPTPSLEVPVLAEPAPPLKVEVVGVPAAPKTPLVSRAALTTLVTILFLAAWHATGLSEADVARWIGGKVQELQVLVETW